MSAADGAVYIADTNNNRLLALSPSGTTYLFSVAGLASHQDGGGTVAAAAFFKPSAIAADDCTGELYVVDGWEGGLPSARYLGVVADAAEVAGAPPEYVHDLRTRPARNIGPGTGD